MAKLDELSCFFVDPAPASPTDLGLLGYFCNLCTRFSLTVLVRKLSVDPLGGLPEKKSIFTLRSGMGWIRRENQGAPELHMRTICCLPASQNF